MKQSEITGISGRLRSGRIWIWMASVVVLLGLGTTVAWWVLLGSIGRGPAAEETELVPEDAQAFVTVLVADALKTDQVGKLLQNLDRLSNGADLNPLRWLRTYEKELGMSLSDVEQVTFVVGKREDKVYWLVVRTSKEIEVSKFFSLLGRFEKQEHAGESYYWAEDADVALCMVNKKQAVVAPRRGMERVLELLGRPERGGPLNDALKLAAKKEHHIVAAVNFQTLLSDEARTELAKTAQGNDVDAEVAAVALGLQKLTYTAQFGQKLEWNLRGDFENTQSAKAAASSLEKLRARARTGLAVVARQIPDTAPLLAALEELRPTQDGAVVKLKAEVDAEVLVNALLRLFLERKDGTPEKR